MGPIKLSYIFLDHADKEDDFVVISYTLKDGTQIDLTVKDLEEIQYYLFKK